MRGTDFRDSHTRGQTICLRCLPMWLVRRYLYQGRWQYNVRPWDCVPQITWQSEDAKCGQLSQQTRRLDPMLFQCWSSAVGGGPILKQHWVKCSRLLGSTQVSVYTHPSATIIFSPADQGTFSKTASQSQAYYNTWNWIWRQPSAHFNMRRSSV